MHFFQQYTHMDRGLDDGRSKFDSLRSQYNRNCANVGFPQEKALNMKRKMPPIWKQSLVIIFSYSSQGKKSLVKNPFIAPFKFLLSIPTHSARPLCPPSLLYSLSKAARMVWGPPASERRKLVFFVPFSRQTKKSNFFTCTVAAAVEGNPMRNY